MKPATVTAEELRAALADLLLAAGGFISGVPTLKKRVLAAAICRASGLLKAEIAAPQAPRRLLTTAEELVADYIERGGDWHELTAAVNRFAGQATCRRYQVTHATEIAQQTPVRH